MKLLGRTLSVGCALVLANARPAREETCALEGTCATAEEGHSFIQVNGIAGGRVQKARTQEAESVKSQTELALEQKVEQLQKELASVKEELKNCRSGAQLEFVKALLPTEELPEGDAEDLRKSLQEEPSLVQELMGQIKKLVKDDLDSNDEEVDEELAGLDEEHAEKLREEDAVAKVEHLAQVLKLQKVGDKDKETKLQKELIDGQTGPEVMKDIVDVVDSIPSPVDKYLKGGVVPTEEDLTHLERLEYHNPDIQDLSDDDAHDEEQEGSSEPGLLSQHRERVNGTFDFHQRWPKGASGKYDVAFCRGTGLEDAAWDAMKKAANELNSACGSLNVYEVAAGDSCKLRTKGNSKGCFSAVGYRGEGGQDLNLQHPGFWSGVFGGTCASKGIAIHEILHALGMKHEQARSDRDKKLKVHENNVKDGMMHNFNKDDRAWTGANYDYGSLMHYGCKAFSTSLLKDTLRASRRRRWWDGSGGRSDCWTMGQRGGLSNHDIDQLKAMYDNCNR